MANSVQYAGPYSPAAYSAARSLANGGSGAPNSAPVVAAAKAIISKQPAAAPVAPVRSASSYGSGSSSTTDPVAAAYYGDQVNALKGVLGTLPTLQDQGVNNIRNNANKSLNDLNTQESQTESNIAESRNTANKNKATSLNNIDQNVADTVDSFKRLTGAAHAGDSAFAQEFVPLATARQGSTQRQGVFNTFGQDMGQLDTAENNAKTAYGSQKEDINNKLNSDLLTFLQNIGQQKDTINNEVKQAQYAQIEAQGGTPGQFSAAAAPYSTNPSDATAALQALFSQYANPTYAVNPVTVSLPNVSSYAVDPLVAQLSAANPDTQTALLPFLPQIKKQTAGTTA